MESLVRLMIEYRDDARSRQRHHESSNLRPDDKIYAVMYARERATLNILLGKAAEAGIVLAGVSLWEGE